MLRRRLRQLLLPLLLLLLPLPLRLPLPLCNRLLLLPAWLLTMPSHSLKLLLRPLLLLLLGNRNALLPLHAHELFTPRSP